MIDAVGAPRKVGLGQSAESVIAISLLGVCAAAGLTAWLSSGGEQSVAMPAPTSAAVALSSVKNDDALQSEEQAVLAQWQRRLDGEFSQHEQSKLQQQQLATLQEQSAALAMAQAAAEAASRAAEAAEIRARSAEKGRRQALAVQAKAAPQQGAAGVQKAAAVRRAASVDWNSCSRPEYPDESVRLGQQGTVTMEFMLDTQGVVQDGRIVESSGTRRLDYRALSALSKCQFEPELLNGEAVEATAQLRFTWKLTR